MRTRLIRALGILAIAGGAFNDTISGGHGNDTLTGGAGVDKFIVTSGTDTITDLGTGGDVTSKATIDADARFTAEMRARQEMVAAGLEIAEAFFRRLDPEVTIELPVKEGDRCEVGTVLMRLAGSARAMPW